MGLNDGLAFKKIDLHVHTPGSDDFKGKVTAEDIIGEAINKGLDAIAITDHNTGAWIDEIKKAAKGKKITIIPGVEITCTGGEKGIHLIALLDIEDSTQTVDALLYSLGLRPDQLGKEGAIVDFPIVDVIRRIQDDYKGLAILAHANSSCGAMKCIRGTQRIELFNQKDLLAVESTDYHNEEKRRNKRRVIDLLDGTDQNFKRKIAVIESSDSQGEEEGHTLVGIGSRYTFFKVEDITIESLRQCFLDPDVRIRQKDELIERRFPRIKSVEVSGGFLGKQKYLFHEGLNSILGGKGSGKSLLVEFMRFCLDQEPSQPEILKDHNSKLQKRLGDYERVLVSADVGSGSEILFERVYNDLLGHPLNVDYEIAQAFPVLFLSQNEIIKISEDEDEQLKFIDQFFDFRKFKQKIKSIEVKLSFLDKEMADSMRAFTLSKSLQEEVNGYEIKLRKIDEALTHPIFARYQSAEKEFQFFRSQQLVTNSVAQKFKEFSQALGEFTAPKIPPEFLREGGIQRNNLTLKELKSELDNLTSTAYKAIKISSEKLEKELCGWQPFLDTAKAEYDEHILKSGGDNKTLAATREKSKNDYDKANSQLQEAIIKSDRLRGISEKREELLNELENIYSEYTKERKDKCQKFEQGSGNRLKLDIKESFDKSDFKETLLSLKKGSYLKDLEIETIADTVAPREFILALLRYSVATSDPGRLFQGIAEKTSIRIENLSHLADWLLESIEYETLLSLQYKSQPKDVPEISYDIGGGNYRLLSELSVGQKSTALLLMALSEGEMPVIIDQPEDSLDLKTIWNDICLKLRGFKGNRQFICTTHSSSVAVSSDSDKFLILEGSSVGSSLVHTGSMDHQPMREEVMLYLEGGIDSYKRKHHKYTGKEIDIV
jgi:PHP family Zn ribbon phosphoesterase